MYERRRRRPPSRLNYNALGNPTDECLDDQIQQLTEEMETLRHELDEVCMRDSSSRVESRLPLHMLTPSDQSVQDERCEWQATLDRNSRCEHCNDEEHRKVQTRLEKEARLEYEERRLEHELRIRRESQPRLELVARREERREVQARLEQEARREEDRQEQVRLEREARLRHQLEQRSRREWQASLERDALHEERCHLQARFSEWDARLENEERRQRELRARVEGEARLEDDDRERRGWQVRYDSRFGREMGSMRLKHEPFQEERETMFEPVQLDSDLRWQRDLDLHRCDYRYEPTHQSNFL